MPGRGKLPVGVPGPFTQRVAGEHVGILREHHVDLAELVGDGLAAFGQHAAGNRVGRQTAVLVGLGVLTDLGAARDAVAVREPGSRHAPGPGQPSANAHSSPRRAPVTAASHKYSASRSWPDARAAAMTFATSAGWGDVAVRGLALGSFAVVAGFRSIHSHRMAVAKAPDKIAWICRIVAADIGRHLCGTQPDRAQSCPGAAGLDRRTGRVPAALPVTTERRPCCTVISPSPDKTASACWAAVTGSPLRLATCRADGSGSPGGSRSEVIASRITVAAWAHAGRAVVGATSMAGNAECSVNGLPEQSRLPHRCSRA